MMIAVTLLIILFTCGWYVSCAVALRCHQCDNVQDRTQCQSVTQCGQDESCFIDRFGDTPYAKFELGCMSNKQCPGQPSRSFNLLGRDLQPVTVPIPRCRECCSTDSCNYQRCGFPVSAAFNFSTLTCTDKDTNCSQLDASIHICTNRPKARLICKKFCGYCSVYDGEWNVWSSWATCSATCGAGTTTRIRTCNNPPPTNGGSECPGNKMEQKSCFPGECPVHGGWASWTPWGDCSESCGIGVMKRHRTCTNPTPSLFGNYCYGDPVDLELCNRTDCLGASPSPAPSNESLCSDKANNCETLNSTLALCAKVEQAVSVCRNYCGLCFIVDGHWSNWNEWGSCSVSCNNGTKSRSRVCNSPAPKYGGKPCPGQANESTICQQHECAVHGSWTIWIAWSDCSTTCDIGMARRRRECRNPKPSVFGSYCQGDSLEYTLCSVQSCAVNGGWSDWGSWSACNSSLGLDGVILRLRERTCNNPPPANGGLYCFGVDQKYDLCKIDIGFTAYLSSGRTYSSGDTIIFNRVITNEGHYYNSGNGTFTAPTPGMYIFTTTIQTYYAYATIYLMKGTEIIGHLYPYDSNSQKYYDTASLTTAARLNIGDIVYVKYASGSKTSSYNIQGKYSFFTGYLENPKL